MKFRYILLSVAPSTGIFGLAYIAITQISVAKGVALTLAIIFGILTFLISLSGLVAFRSLAISDKIYRGMASKELIKQIDRNARRENRRELGHVFHQVEATIQLESIYGFKHLLPPSRSWAASPDLIVEIINQIRDRKPQLIVEVGSGLSTLWIARVLQQLGTGRLISIDHDAFFAAKTSQHLATNGLEHLVDLRVGELEEQTWPDGTQNWYPHALMNGIEKIDLLIVDGPPRNDSETYRWPAMWELESRMNDSAAIILDDAIRLEEANLAVAWSDRGNYNLEIKNLEKRAGILTR